MWNYYSVYLYIINILLFFNILKLSILKTKNFIYLIRDKQQKQQNDDQLHNIK